MDTLTHALSGALVVQTLLVAKSGRPDTPRHLTYGWLLLAGFLAAAFPDADAVAGFFGSLAYLNNHRGITHSIFMLPLWAGLLAVVFSMLARQRYSWSQFYLPCLLAVGIHIAGDVITAYGTMIFEPFSSFKASWPVTFIIDPYFTAIILLALIATLLLKQHRRKLAIAGLVVLCGYVGFQGLLRQQALDIAQDYAVANQLDMTGLELEAIPQPLSPFNWKLMVMEKEIYHIAYLDLLNGQPEESRTPDETGDDFFSKVNALYQPATDLKWLQRSRFGNDADDERLIREIWMSQLLRDIRQFMIYPVFSHTENDNNGYCIWFLDERFILEGVRSPFQFGACRLEESPTWNLVRRRDNKVLQLR